MKGSVEKRRRSGSGRSLKCSSERKQKKSGRSVIKKRSRSVFSAKLCSNILRSLYVWLVKRHMAE